MELNLIDIGYPQGEFDWEKYQDEFSGAIIRISGGTVYPDSQFERNVSECERLGIPFGAYLYCRATNDEEAEAEADYAIAKLAGHHLSYPVFLDCEYGQIIGHTASNYAIWERKLTEAGYTAGVYARDGWFNGELKGVDETSPAVWIAAWGANDGEPHENVKPTRRCHIWQYTSMGYFDSTRCDLDLCFHDFPAELGQASQDLKTEDEEAIIVDTDDNQRRSSMSKEQIKNIIQYAATLVVFVLGLFGITMDEDTASIIVIGVALVALVAWGCWKNQNITAFACLAQRILDALKEQVLTPESVEALLETVTESDSTETETDEH